MNTIIYNLLKYCNKTKWTIGFSEQPLNEIVDPNKPITVSWVHHNYTKSWFADPFILDVTDEEIVLLVEEYYDPIKRGRISKMILDRHSYFIKQLIPILELPTHLSFPAIKRNNDGLFFYPESGVTGKLVMYRLDTKKNECKPIKDICYGPLADAVIVEIAEQEFLFATEVPNHNGCELLEYRKRDGRFEVCNSIHFDSRIARNAGDWFECDGILYRPAQDCNHGYGGAIVLQKVLQDGDKLNFTDVKRIESSDPEYCEGCHTLNHYKGLTVFDACGYRRPRLVKGIRKISQLVKKIRK